MINASPDVASFDPSSRLAAAREHIAHLETASVELLIFLRGLTETVAEALAIPRVGAWLLVDERRRLALLHQHDARADSDGFEGVVLEVGSFPSYFRALEKSRPALVAADAMRDARLVEQRDSYLGALGVGALLDVPLVRDGAVIGVLRHCYLGAPHEFSAAEIDLATWTAETLVRRLDAAGRGEPDVEGQLTGVRTLKCELRSMTDMVRLAAGLGHDLNNLLTVIGGNAELLGDVSADVHNEAQARRISAAVERGRLLAEALLVLGRRRPSAPRVVKIAEHMARSAPYFEHDLGLPADDATTAGHVEAEPPGPRLTFACSGVGAAMVDLRELDRVVHELMLNARARMTIGGAVRLAVRDRRLEHGPRAGSWVVLEVSDDGPALEADDEHWFEPFAPCDQTPSGLGLPIVKHLVTRAGGFVEIGGQTRGAAMRVHFPRIA